MTRAIVVGGGPGGMMAAGICAAQGRETLLIEKNPQLGKKLRITGKGRCNLTNQCSVEDMVATAQGGKFLYTALSAFPPQAVMDFFTSLGVALKTERGRRVFPQSNSAHQVADALEHFALNQGVRRVRDQVLAVETENGSVTGVRTRSGVMPAGAVLLACGGASYPGTGSDGSGSRLARALGHTIIELAPSLVPLVEQGETCRRLMGLSLRNCGVQVRAKGKKKPKEKTADQLSKGNQQKIQLMAALLSEPELIVLDEPLSGLDPVNSDLFKSIIKELMEKDIYLIMSSHQMETIEEFSSNITILNRGNAVLQGDLNEIKKSYGRVNMIVKCDDDIEEYIKLFQLNVMKRTPDGYHIKVTGEQQAMQFLAKLTEQKVSVVRFELREPSLHEIFVEKVGTANE